MGQYLENVREIERRIETVEARNTNGEEREIPEAPPGVPDSFTEHMQMMFDVQVLALETDMTRVISFKTGRDAQSRVFTESESDRPFHPASHHGNREEAVLEFNKINQFRVGQLPYLIDKLENTMDGESSLLDQSVVLWGSPMADANLHNHRRAPLFFLGHGNGLLDGNMHIQAPDETPMANAMLTLLHGLGHLYCVDTGFLLDVEGHGGTAVDPVERASLFERLTHLGQVADPHGPVASAGHRDCRGCRRRA